jgi:hypothetical protein
MRARRMAYWWFWFVVSGRFLEKFLNLRYNSFVSKTLNKGAARSTASRVSASQVSDGEIS